MFLFHGFSLLQKKNNKNNENNNNNKNNESKNEGEIKKKEGGDAEKKKDEKSPLNVVLKVEIHCEGCASKIIKCVRDFEGYIYIINSSSLHLLVFYHSFTVLFLEVYPICPYLLGFKGGF